MLRMNKNKKGQAGFVITVELLLIVVILVMGLVSGWAKVRDQTAAELGDTGDAIGAIDQSYRVMGTQWLLGNGTGPVGAHAGFQFDDALDAAVVPSAVGGDGAFQGYSSAPVPAVTGTTLFEVSVF